MTSTLLQFQPFASNVQPDFWHTFASLKVNALQLSDERVPLRGTYSLGRTAQDRATGQTVSLAPNFVLEGEAFENAGSTSTSGAETRQSPEANAVRPGRWQPVVSTRGYLKNYNTVEAFKQADKAAMFDQLAAEILHELKHGAEPEAHLNRFFVLAFADLKKFKFYYWFAFPAILVEPAWQISPSGWANAATALGEKALHALDEALPGLASRQGRGRDSGFHGAFLVRKAEAVGAELAALSDFATFFGNTTEEEERTVAFIDPSAHPTQPGWPLRNLLLLLRVRYGVRGIRVLRWLDQPGSLAGVGSEVKSLIGSVHLPEVEGSTVPPVKLSPASGDGGSDPLPIPQATGWERNARGALAPKVSDLGPLMDPARLADQAVDLNLQLMRWRIMPEIQLEKVKQTKCLLFGAGTLGCYVARTLMGWGVRHITLIDNAHVSYSNPVRQPLFDFEDCLHGGKPKAPCAAEKLRKIYPGVNADGHMLAVPMPGHPIASASREKTDRDLSKIEALVEQHDVLFLLMDSRESRWLPSLLGAAKGKLVINAALGFDTYVVMRHGAPPDAADAAAPPATGKRLGCYFCNDIVAPSDSLADRTLDQMCTVSRPGLAGIAGASAVELMASVLQHKDGVRAPASASQPPGSQDSAASSGSCLGLIPHQIRGFLAQYNNMLITGQAYDRCTACSGKVVEAYRKDGHALVFKACDEEGFLEELTGLKQMYEETEALEHELEVDWDDDEGSLS